MWREKGVQDGSISSNSQRKCGTLTFVSILLNLLLSIWEITYVLLYDIST